MALAFDDGQASGATPEGMVWIPGRTFTMGSNDHYPEEAPAHPVKVNGFWIDEIPVTNRRFTEFVKATGYVTFAEKTPEARTIPAPGQRCCAPDRLSSSSRRPSADPTSPNGGPSSSVRTGAGRSVA